MEGRIAREVFLGAEEDIAGWAVLHTTLMHSWTELGETSPTREHQSQTNVLAAASQASLFLWELYL